MGEGFQAGRAVFRLIDFARAEAVQQRAQHPAHMGVVVDDEETQAVEIDADHGAPGLGRLAPDTVSVPKLAGPPLTNGLASMGERPTN